MIGIRKTGRVASYVISLLFVLLLSYPLSAQGSAITDGVSWLETNQEPSGMWGAFRDATVTLDVLSGAGAELEVLQNAGDAIYESSVSSCDYLARKIIAIASYDDDYLSAEWLDNLANMQHDDGGWGFAPDYPIASNLETALAVRALHSADYDNTTAMILGIDFLGYNRNADDAWGFVYGDSSRVFYTAHAVIAIIPLLDVYSIATELVDDAVTWLKSQANGDGGFGTGGVSNPYETGLALAAVSQVDPGAPEVAAARTYLETTQLPNGSWNDDAYSTALALFGMISQDNLQARSLPLSPGLTLLGLPLEPLTPPTSTDLCALVTCCEDIMGWNRLSQGWFAGEFDVAVQDGFFMQTSTTCGLPITGMLLEKGECDSLRPNLNAISIPNENACYSAATLMDDIDDCEEIHKWDQAKQKWISLAKTDGDTLRGSDFSIDPGCGYFIRRDDGAGDVEWCTQACDTTTPPETLPDLLLTYYDVYLNPNPAAEGEVVSIAAMVHNIGTDTAHNPRLSFYLGDPDAGGGFMANYDIPEDILPGSSASQYYGYGFTFTGCGYGEIYVVADYAGVIEELSEDNNKAHRTLVITCSSPSEQGPLTVADDHPSYPGKSSRPTFSAGVAGNLQLLDFQPTNNLRATNLSASAAPVIVAVDAGSPTSSSAVITFLVYGLELGCVNYGISSVDENSACEYNWWGGWTHQVELEGLLAGTTYLFEVVVGETTDNNGGAFYNFTTTSAGAGKPAVFYGQVVHEDLFPAAGAVVSVTLEHLGATSYPLTCMTDWDGSWLLNLGNAKDALTDDVLSYDAGDALFITVRGSGYGTGGDTVSASTDIPQNMGTITLSPCDCGLQGDMNDDDSMDPLDVTYLLNYVYKGSDELEHPPNCPYQTGDVNCDGTVDPLDVTFLLNAVYKGSNLLCDQCNP